MMVVNEFFLTHLIFLFLFLNVVLTYISSVKILKNYFFTQLPDCLNVYFLHCH